MSETVLDRIVTHLKESLAHNANAHVEPVALLWPDEGAQWQQVVDRISAPNGVGHGRIRSGFVICTVDEK